MRRASWIWAYRWARDRASDHEIHVEEECLPLFPLGSLAAAAALSDAQFFEFLDWLVLARAQYLAFL